MKSLKRSHFDMADLDKRLDSSKNRNIWGHINSKIWAPVKGANRFIRWSGRLTTEDIPIEQ